MQLEKYKRRERNQVSESTVNARMSALRNLNEFNGGSEPDVQDVEEWIDNLIQQHEEGKIKASTIRQYYKAARYYFSKIKNEPDSLDHITDWMPEKDVDHGAYLTEEEWERLKLNISGLRDRAFIKVMYHYARRPGEVLLLNEEDIDFDEGTIKFSILKKEKDDRGQKLPMLQLKRDGEVYREHRVFGATFDLVDNIRGDLKRLIDFTSNQTETVVYDGEEKEVTPLFSGSNPRVSYSTVRKSIKRAAKSAGIDKNITPKSGRHSRATHLNWAGHSPAEIADRQLVHDPDTEVIGAYVHPRDEDDTREVMSTEQE